MTASDFEVRENGTVRPIELLPTTEPLRVALIVSQIGRNHRLIPAARAFCESFDGNGEVSVTAVMDEAEVLSGFSDRVGDCLAGLNRLEIKEILSSRTSPDLIDTILHASGTISREGWRSAIVVLRAGSERSTPLYGERLRDPIRASGAVLYVASTPEAEKQLTASRGLAMSTIVDSAIDSGGRHVLLGADATVMRPVAWELAARYRIRYTVPTGMRSGSKLSVTSSRLGVTVLAPRITR